MAQYILAVGVFVVGGMLVIHSRDCKCWSSSQTTAQHGAHDRSGQMELDNVDSALRIEEVSELPA